MAFSRSVSKSHPHTVFALRSHKVKYRYNKKLERLSLFRKQISWQLCMGVELGVVSFKMYFDWVGNLFFAIQLLAVQIMAHLQIS